MPCCLTLFMPTASNTSTLKWSHLRSIVSWQEVEPLCLRNYLRVLHELSEQQFPNAANNYHTILSTLVNIYSIVRLNILINQSLGTPFRKTFIEWARGDGLSLFKYQNLEFGGLTVHVPISKCFSLHVVRVSIDA